MLRWVLLLLVLATPLRAEKVVLGLSRDEVAITATFDGSNILIFGAIKREAPIPADTELEVIIALAGPSEPVTVRRKERVAGIWANVDAVEVDAAPSFYAVLSSAPLDEALSAVEDLRNDITIPRAIRSVGAPMNVKDSEAFTRALIRIRERAGLYQVLENSVDLEEDTLFRGQVTLPANLTEGPYRTRIFLTRDGSIVDVYETEIAVNKVGLERWLYELSRNQPLLYGLMALAIAVAAGWGASTGFRLLQR
ncbi:TIGR02186 family protein [Salibaculum sp.]|uniref:TIGR02186 family protein n=1 Tax=Salibaculum sp. TaxID=2855480 RepID=UPI002B47493A|nr:TIGR02186 family protein [Salibaculum sp.]HKL68198.1 TIGR02186 family protein [Salibaculum sp.]